MYIHIPSAGTQLVYRRRVNSTNTVTIIHNTMPLATPTIMLVILVASSSLFSLSCSTETVT